MKIVRFHYGSFHLVMWVRYLNRNVQKIAEKWKGSSKRGEGEIYRLRTRNSLRTGEKPWDELKWLFGTIWSTQMVFACVFYFILRMRTLYWVSTVLIMATIFSSKSCFSCCCEPFQFFLFQLPFPKIYFTASLFFASVCVYHDQRSSLFSHFSFNLFKGTVKWENIYCFRSLSILYALSNFIRNLWGNRCSQFVGVKAGPWQS